MCGPQIQAAHSIHDGDSHLPLHRHDAGYIAVVIEGAYEETSPDGRFPCAAGTLIEHPDHHPHRNEFMSAGARVLNLPVPIGGPSTYRVGTSTAVDAIARLAETNILAAARAAVEELDADVRSGLRPPPWLANMALTLRSDALLGSTTPVGDLADRAGISAAHASRSFRRWFGLAPVQYRLELRVRHARSLLAQGMCPTDVAFAAGFSDQSHMCRTVKAVTGLSPRQLSRRSTKPSPTPKAVR